MKCGWCLKPVRAWQRRVDTEWHFEHRRCHQKRLVAFREDVDLDWLRRYDPAFVADLPPEFHR